MPPTHTTERLELATLPSGSSMETTVHRYTTGRPGPTVYLQSAQHGSEITGTEILRQLHDELRKAEPAGEVIAVPVANPLTFERRRRRAPLTLESENPNMNRVWPGDPAGSIHERAAATLWELVATADVVVDLHSISSVQLPHLRVSEHDVVVQRLASAFGTEMLLPTSVPNDATERYDSGDLRESLRGAAHTAGITAMTVEIGHSRQLTQSAVPTGVAGLRSLLEEVDVLHDVDVSTDEPTFLETHHGAEVTRNAGLFVPDPELSLRDRVAAGDELGSVVDPRSYEVRQRIAAKADGFVWYIGREATVFPGDGVVGVAVPAEKSESDPEADE